MDRTQFLSSLRSLISYHQSCGFEGYHIDNDIHRKIKVLKNDHSAPAPAERVKQSAVLQKQQDVGNIEVEGETPPTKTIDLSTLTTDIERCSKCSLHKSRQISTAGKGGNRPLLLIVGDWLIVSGGNVPVAGQLFGQAQDEMLAKMIRAIKLNEEDVFATNVIKCSLPDSCQPISEHIGTCGAYLMQQIDILEPQIICSMGIIASRLLTGRAQPLSQQRGRFVLYKTEAGQQIPLMPTYHPTFLLQNPEMKAATWADLQEIEKKIREIKKTFS